MEGYFTLSWKKYILQYLLFLNHGALSNIKLPDIMVTLLI